MHSSFCDANSVADGRRVHFVQRRPEPHDTVSYGQRKYINSPAFEVEWHLAPALRGLAHPTLDGQEPFVATGRYANNYLGIELVMLTPKDTVDAVSSVIDQLLVI